MFVLPFSLSFLGGARDDAAAAEQETPPAPSTPKGAQSPAASPHASPIVSVGETHIGVNWDDTAVPQLMLSISIQDVE